MIRVPDRDTTSSKFMREIMSHLTNSEDRDEVQHLNK